MAAMAMGELRFLRGPLRSTAVLGRTAFHGYCISVKSLQVYRSATAATIPAALGQTIFFSEPTGKTRWIPCARAGIKHPTIVAAATV